MSTIYILIPLALFVGIGAVMAFIWMVRSGQMDDLDTPPVRMLFDEDSPTNRAPESSDLAENSKNPK